MREIKFRAWDKATDRMLETGFHILGEVTCFGIIEQIVMEQPMGRTTLERIRDVVLMQFTGLKDRNEKEIYEGDIIELVNDVGETIRVLCEYGIARRDVMSGGLGIEVDIPCFYFRLPNGKKSFPIVKNYAGKHDLQIFEIIGNIYENPEFIDAMKTEP